MNIRIFNFGSLNIDYVYQIDHIVKPGETTSSHKMQVVTLEKRFPRTAVILTRGSQGAEFLFEGMRIHQDIFTTDVIDTTAAGDTFTGFFLSAIANGQDAAVALRIASKASSITVSRMGASTSIPYLKECTVGY